MWKITQMEVKRLFEYNYITGVLTWKVNKGNGKGGANIGSRAGSLNDSGYLVTQINSINYRNHRLIWLWYYGYIPRFIDHKDTIKTHNWIDNLKETTKVVNAQNCGNPKDNTSGVKGVYKHNYSLWTARIGINGKSYSLGYYKRMDDAICARLAAEQCLNWDEWESSSPAYKYVKGWRVR